MLYSNLIRGLILLFLTFSGTVANGQVEDFKKSMNNADPVIDYNNDFDYRLGKHTEYLNKAEENKQALNQIYGNLYVYTDYVRTQDFEKALFYLDAADKLARISKEKGWIGWVQYRRGFFYSCMRNADKAIEYYKKGAENCRLAGDSLCYGECMEQLSAMYGVLEKYELSNDAYNIAIPLIKKYGDKHIWAIAVNNLALRQVDQGKYQEAIINYKKSNIVFRELEIDYDFLKNQNNIADLQIMLNQYDSAITILNDCIIENKKLNITENLITNYNSMYRAYKAKGSLKEAIQYSSLYQNLNDSFLGVATQLKIEELNHNNELIKNELIAQKKTDELWRYISIAIISTLILLIIVYLLHNRLEKIRKKAAFNKEQLENITSLLYTKNTRIIEMEMSIKSLTNSNKTAEENEKEVFDEYNDKILTTDDWNNFKKYFNNSYPKYINNLRKRFNNLTDSEERLCLLMKTGLRQKEMANILGISADSVKKTRYRLRKKLELGSEDSIEEFILKV